MAKRSKTKKSARAEQKIPSVRDRLNTFLLEFDDKLNTKSDSSIIELSVHWDNCGQSTHWKAVVCSSDGYDVVAGEISDGKVELQHKTAFINCDSDVPLEHFDEIEWGLGVWGKRS